MASIDSVFNVIGGVFGVLGLIQFAQDLIPKGPIEMTSVAVAVGQTAQDPTIDDPQNMKGNIPAISVYSLGGSLVGSNRGDKKKTWAAGSKQVVHLQNKVGVEAVQSEYVAIYATGTNALCISAIGLTNPNDANSHGWFSDVGVTCGMQFHWSETVVGEEKGKNPYRPNCVWISGPGSKNGVITQGLSMHITDFSQVSDAQAQAYNNNFDIMCGSAPRFSAWTAVLPGMFPPVFLPSLQYNEDKTDVDVNKLFVPGIDKTDYGHIPFDSTGLTPQHAVRLPTPDNPVIAPNRPIKRQEHKPAVRPRSIHHTLISSRHPEHSAKNLCNSATSWGPDVVSETERLFCDMDAKELWPLCETKSQMSCFDTEMNTLRGGSAKRAVVPEKRYAEVKRWGPTK